MCAGPHLGHDRRAALARNSARHLLAEDGGHFLVGLGKVLTSARLTVKYGKATPIAGPICIERITSLCSKQASRATMELVMNTDDLVILLVFLQMVIMRYGKGLCSPPTASGTATL